MLERYDGAFSRLRLWLYDVQPAWLAGHAHLRDAVQRLAEVYLRCWRPYRETAFETEHARLEEDARRINASLRTVDLIGRWEPLTGIVFKFDRYEIVLSNALEGGPNANSLGYERNLYYPGADLERAVQFISHETGTHLLVDLFKAAMRDHPDFLQVYRAYECLAHFYSRRVLSEPLLYEMPAAYEYDRFGQLYETVLRADPAAAPARLLEATLRLGDRQGAPPEAPPEPGPRR